MLAVLAFHDDVSLVNLAGLTLCISGTLAFHRTKRGREDVDGRPSAHGDYDPVHMADMELESFINTEDDGELSDGWDDI